MTRDYLKKAILTATSDAGETHGTVKKILTEIEAGGDAVALEYARKLDNYDGNVLLTSEDIETASAAVPEKLKADIRYAHANIERFAQAQKATLSEVELEIAPGLYAGQKVIPVDAAGCYLSLIHI